MLKPEVGDYYKNQRGDVFKVVSVYEPLGYATIEWIDEDLVRTWDYVITPDPIGRKLTSLEIELL